MNLMKSKIWLILFLPISAPITLVHAEAPKGYLNSAKKGMSHLFAPQPANFNQVSIQALSNFPLDTQQMQEALPVVVSSAQPPRDRAVTAVPTGSGYSIHELNMMEAIHQALQRRPEISRSIASIAGQSANIDAAKAQYYPQISGGISTADFLGGARPAALYLIGYASVI